MDGNNLTDFELYCAVLFETYGNDPHTVMVDKGIGLVNAQAKLNLGEKILSGLK